MLHWLTDSGNTAERFVSGSPVVKILIENQQAVNVNVMVKGQRFSAPAVISNADVRQTVFELIGEQYFSSRFIRRHSSHSNK